MRLIRYLILLFFCAIATQVAAESKENEIYQLPDSQWVVELEKDLWIPDTLKFIFSFVEEHALYLKDVDREEMGFLAQKRDRSGFFCFAELKDFDVDFPYVGRFDKFIAAISQYNHTRFEGQIDKKKIDSYTTTGKCYHDLVGEGVWKFIYTYTHYGKVNILLGVSFDKQNSEAFFENVELCIKRIE